MKESKFFIKSGRPFFTAEEKIIPPVAYITYFEERNNYKDFAEKGFKVFSVSVSLADMPINPQSGFKPFEGGVFDKKGQTDFTSVDASVKEIVKYCPDAYIFPRIYVTMPQWWVDENPGETIEVPYNARREMLFSKKFREDAAEMLCKLIEHFKSFEWAENIFGYQISGGTTQEWFHFDRHGSYCDEILPYFNEYLVKKGKLPLDKMPPLYEFENSEVIENEDLREYLRFANESVAETVEHFCAVAKKAVDRKQFVGAFYGYTAEVCDQLHGTHAINKLLDSENIDFFSSPNSYTGSRKLGVDWGDMMPADSIKLHGKMCFIENDIRTFLSKSPNSSRKGSDPHNYYTDKVWEGPQSEDGSVWAVRKSLAKQLTSGHGFWWFDMFGHWFETEKLMNEMKMSLDIYNEEIQNPFLNKAEVLVFLDEECYSKTGKKHPLFRTPDTLRDTLGNIGAPYKVYLINDFYKIDWENSDFKAAIFNIQLKDEKLCEMGEFLKDKNIGSMFVSDEAEIPGFDKITAFLKECGVFIYSGSGDTFYIGNGYCALHAAEEGEKTIKFPEKVKCTNVVTKEIFEGSSISFNLQKYETILFKTEKTEEK